MKNKNLIKSDCRYITLPNTNEKKSKLVAKITEVGITINKHKNYAYRADGESGIAYRTYKTRSLEALNVLLEMYSSEESISEEYVKYKVPVTEFYINNHGVYYITLIDYCRFCKDIDFHYNNLYYNDRDINRCVYWQNIKRSY